MAYDTGELSAEQFNADQELAEAAEALFVTAADATAASAPFSGQQGLTVTRRSWQDAAIDCSGWRYGISIHDVTTRYLGMISRMNIEIDGNNDSSDPPLYQAAELHLNWWTMNNNEECPGGYLGLRCFTCDDVGGSLQYSFDHREQLTLLEAIRLARFVVADCVAQKLEDATYSS